MDIVMFLGAAFFFAVGYMVSTHFQNTKKSSKARYSYNNNHTVTKTNINTDDESQVSNDKAKNAKRFTFVSKKLMNNEEDRVYRGLVSHFMRQGLFQKKFKLLCQVGVGGFINSPTQEGVDGKLIFAKTISALRVDYLVIDEENKPVVVIEYHGKGHSRGGNWKVNDEVKDTLCEKTGIKLVIITDETPFDAKFTKISDILFRHYNKSKGKHTQFQQ